MKLVNLTLLTSALFFSFSSQAIDNIEFEKPADLAEKPLEMVSPSDFFGWNDNFYIKTDKGIKSASTLVKGQKVYVGQDNREVSITGKLVVKLNKDISANAFARKYGLTLDWASKSNLVILAAEEGKDLLEILKTVQNQPGVIRAKLDQAIPKYEPM